MCELHLVLMLRKGNIFDESVFICMSCYLLSFCKQRYEYTKSDITNQINTNLLNGW